VVLCGYCGQVDVFAASRRCIAPPWCELQSTLFWQRAASRLQIEDSLSKARSTMPNVSSRLEKLILHPFLLACFPPLALCSHNPGGVMLWEFALVAAISITYAALALVALRRYCYSTWLRAALGASWLVMLTYSFWYTGKINDLLQLAALPPVPPAGLLCLWAAIVVGGLIWLRRPRDDEAQFNRFANLFGAVAVGGPLVMVIMSAARQPHQIEWTPAPAPAPEAIVLQKPAEPRDIYYLVFDRYGSESTLRGQFGHDNRGFLKQLQQRGFTVANRSFANYPKTDISMSSALNMRYHKGGIAPKSHYMNLLLNHRAGLLLKQQGYRYHHLGGLLDGIRWNPHADENYTFSPAPTEYTDILLQFTPLYPWIGTRSNPRRVLDKFTMLQNIPAQPGPVFAYAHFVTPHEPWKFDRDGARMTRALAATRTERENYVNQLIYTNSRILETIDVILARSKRTPIIVIQSDEGPELRYEGDEERSELSQIGQRSGIISAFLLPDRDGASLVPDSISPVNTFRLIFREYFAADLPLLEDRNFYWNHPNELGKPDHNRPGEFVDVTRRLTGAEELVHTPALPSCCVPSQD